MKAALVLPWPFAVLFLAIDAVIWYSSNVFEGARRRALKKTVGFLASFASFFVFNAIAGGLILLIVPPADAWAKLHPAWAMQITIVTFAGLLGVGAHRFKKINKALYGVSEVVFAVLYAMNNASRVDPSKPDQQVVWVSILGSAYIVARGMNNISDATEERQKKVLSSR
jgi:hypothetical protein